MLLGRAAIQPSVIINPNASLLLPVLDYWPYQGPPKRGPFRRRLRIALLTREPGIIPSCA